jgi:hypothetical protein
MSIFHRKAGAPDVYTFAGVTEDNQTAASIQHHVNLLRYMAEHPRLTKRDLATYLDMCERYGMGTDKAHRAGLLTAYVPNEQAAKLRLGLAQVHLDALTERIHELGEGTPTTEKIKMLEFAVNESQKTKSAFV